MIKVGKYCIRKLLAPHPPQPEAEFQVDQGYVAIATSSKTAINSSPTMAAIILCGLYSFSL